LATFVREAYATSYAEQSHRVTAHVMT
jgi:hypothetical protein